MRKHDVTFNYAIDRIYYRPLHTAQAAEWRFDQRKPSNEGNRLHYSSISILENVARAQYADASRQEIAGSCEGMGRRVG